MVLGRGGSGKSTLARRLGAAKQLPVVELDKHFWPPDLTPLPPERWRTIQSDLVTGDRWVLDCDLGPYDALEVRLRSADTVVVLDFPLWLCAWRAIRRSRENLVFWRWVIGYRRRSLPTIMAAIVEYAPTADVLVLHSPSEVEEFFAKVG
jgi:adenylate kinase family enzyme